MKEGFWEEEMWWDVCTVKWQECAAEAWAIPWEMLLDATLGLAQHRKADDGLAGLTKDLGSGKVNSLSWNNVRHTGR